MGQSLLWKQPTQIQSLHPALPTLKGCCLLPGQALSHTHPGKHSAFFQAHAPSCQRLSTLWDRACSGSSQHRSRVFTLLSPTLKGCCLLPGQALSHIQPGKHSAFFQAHAPRAECLCGTELALEAASTHPESSPCSSHFEIVLPASRASPVPYSSRQIFSLFPGP